jgi:hypothetical protein
LTFINGSLEILAKEIGKPENNYHRMNRPDRADPRP